MAFSASLVTGNTFSTGDSATAAKLNAQVNSATFASSTASVLIGFDSSKNPVDYTLSGTGVILATNASPVFSGCASFIGTGSFVAGGIMASSINGLCINAKTGAFVDFTLFDPTGATAIMSVLTGTIGVKFAGAINALGEITCLHNRSNSGPIAATPLTAAGSGATAAPITFSTDVSGIFQLQTGSGPTTGSLVTITYGTTYASTPTGVVLTPANPAAAALSGAQQVYVLNPASSASFTVTSGTSALSAATIYLWYYRVN